MFLRIICVVACCALWAQDKVVNTQKSAGYTLKFTEELRIGSEDGDDAYIWPSNNTKIFPGPDQTFYIIDPDGSRILVFDKDGQFIRQATGPGNGPGELQAVFCVSQDKAGKIYVVDMPPNSMQAQPTLKIFKPDMTFERKILSTDLGYQPVIVKISPDGKYLGGLYYKMAADFSGLTLKLGVLDIEAKEMVNLFYDFDMPMPDFQRMQDKDMWTDYLASQFKMLYSFTVFTFDNKGNGYSAISDKYVVKQWHPGDKEPLRVIERKYKPRPFGDTERAELLDRFEENIPPNMAAIVTRQVMDRGLAKADLPRVKPPLNNLIGMDDGFMVVHDIDAKKRTNTLDVFNSKGTYLCQVEMEDFGAFAFTGNNPYPRLVFRDGYAYTILTDADMENYAVRYKYELIPPKS